MPSGRTHDRITLWSLPPIAGISYLLTREGELTFIVAGAFLFGGLMLGPDLDIYSLQYKRWGKLRWIWKPYQMLVTHRSQLSHGLIIGTTLRIIYLLVCAIAIAVPGVAVAQLIWGFDWNWQQVARTGMQWMAQNYRQEAIALVIGLELGSMSHSLSDWIGSSYKRWQKKRSFKRKKEKGKRKK